jgi:D-alanyl-D-alanine carboxypeptidase (penicillin-binding protein 5/6)
MNQPLLLLLPKAPDREISVSTEMISHTPVLQQTNDSSLSHPSLWGVATLGLIFIASSVFAFAYVRDTMPSSQHIDTAAANSALEPASPFAHIQLRADSAYVYDLSTHEVLFALHPDTPRPLASLTKVATVLAASEVLSPDSTITIPYDTGPVGRPERLSRGAIWKVRDVINFTLITSSNQGADILAASADMLLHQKYPEAPEGSATLWRMNNLAQTLGLVSMYFRNESGLDISDTQAGAYGSARDVSLLFAYAAASRSALFAGTTQNDMLLTAESGEKTPAFNTNTELGSIPGLVLGKTGLTNLAGGNLAVVFDAGLGHMVVAVVLGSTENDRFLDMKKLVTATGDTLAGGAQQ